MLGLIAQLIADVPPSATFRQVLNDELSVQERRWCCFKFKSLRGAYLVLFDCRRCQGWPCLTARHCFVRSVMRSLGGSLGAKCIFAGRRAQLRWKARRSQSAIAASAFALLSRCAAVIAASDRAHTTASATYASSQPASNCRIASVPSAMAPAAAVLAPLIDRNLIVRLDDVRTSCDLAGPQYARGVIGAGRASALRRMPRA